MVTRKRFCCLVIFCLIFSWPVLAVASEEEIFELKVAKRDKLINICKKYLEDPAKWQEVSKLNKLKNPNLIHPGQTLKIPVRLLKGTPLDAKVTFIKGEVLSQEKEGEEWTKLNLNDRVLQGSTIKSGDTSAVEITFEDGASFSSGLIQPWV